MMNQSESELLHTAVGLTQLQGSHFSELSVRFAPFDQEVSRFLEKYGCELEKLYRKKSDLIKTVPAPERLLPTLTRYRWHYENRFRDDRHFFVTHSQMAHDVLVKTLNATIEHLSFYWEAVDMTEETGFKTLYDQAGTVVYGLCRRLMDFISRYKQEVEPVYGTYQLAGGFR